MDTILKYKSIFGSIEDIDMKNKIVTGYLSSFGNKDYDDDIILRGAYKKSITERKNDIYFLNQHDWKQPHGKFNVLEEREKGLYFESTPLIDTSYSMDALKLYQAGIVKEHSVGYQVMKEEYSKNDQANIIKEIKLYEGSNVTLGANSNTPFTGFKSYNLKQVNDQYKQILKAYRNGTFTDETFGLLDIALKQLQAQMFELGKKSLETTTADNVTDIEVKKPIIISTEKQIINDFLKNHKWN
jgi:HK97 family phage prohead protease